MWQSSFGCMQRNTAKGHDRGSSDIWWHTKAHNATRWPQTNSLSFAQAPIIELSARVCSSRAEAWNLWLGAWNWWVFVIRPAWKFEPAHAYPCVCVCVCVDADRRCIGLVQPTHGALFGCIRVALFRLISKSTLVNVPKGFIIFRNA